MNIRYSCPAFFRQIQFAIKETQQSAIFLFNLLPLLRGRRLTPEEWELIPTNRAEAYRLVQALSSYISSLEKELNGRPRQDINVNYYYRMATPRLSSLKTALQHRRMQDRCL